MTCIANIGETRYCWQYAMILGSVRTFTDHLCLRHTLEPAPCNSGIIGKKEDSDTITIIPYSHYLLSRGST